MAELAFVHMMLEYAIQEIVDQALESRVFGCISMAVRHPGGPVSIHCFGAMAGMQTHSRMVFDAASLTKVLATGLSAQRLVLENRLDPETPVMEILEGFSTSHCHEVRVRHLLTHALDYRIPLASLRMLPPQAIINRVLHHQFEDSPGRVFQYGNPSSLVLGLLLEHVCAKSLPELALELVWGPLGLVHTGYYPLACGIALRDIVPTELCPWRGRALRGEVHDESAWALQQDSTDWNGRACGHAGVFTTIADLGVVMDMLLRDGILPFGPEGGCRRVFPAGILKLSSTDALGLSPSPGIGQGPWASLGWELCNRRFLGTVAGPRSFGKTGFTGASLAIDPDRDAGVAMLSDFTWPRREATVDRIYQFRRKIHDAVFGSFASKC